METTPKTGIYTAEQLEEAQREIDKAQREIYKAQQDLGYQSACEYSSILRDCIRTGEERVASYGSVIDNFKEMAAIHNAMFGGELKPSDLCKVLIATKVSREKYKHKEDNLIDQINYNAILLFLLKNKL